MPEKFKYVGIDIKTHKIVKLESVKRGISMKKLVHDAVIEYLERHEIERTDLPLAKKTPEKEGNLIDFFNVQDSIKERTN